MKLVIGGATGFLGKEVLSQALQRPEITSVVALARRETPLPKRSLSEADRAKFKSVVCEDFTNYSQHVDAEISGADACIWTIAITPMKARSWPWEELRKVCVDYAVNAADVFAKQPRGDKSDPFRFFYVSGVSGTRDPAKKPWMLGDYSVMRGEAETQVLERARAGAFDVAIAKPGLITDSNAGSLMRVAQTVVKNIIPFPAVRLDEIAAALLDQAIHGIKVDTIENAQLVEIGQKALKDGKAAQ